MSREFAVQCPSSARALSIDPSPTSASTNTGVFRQPRISSPTSADKSSPNQKHVPLQPVAPLGLDQENHNKTSKNQSRRPQYPPPGLSYPGRSWPLFLADHLPPSPLPLHPATKQPICFGFHFQNSPFCLDVEGVSLFWLPLTQKVVRYTRLLLARYFTTPGPWSSLSPPRHSQGSPRTALSPCRQSPFD